MLREYRFKGTMCACIGWEKRGGEREERAVVWHIHTETYTDTPSVLMKLWRNLTRSSMSLHCCPRTGQEVFGWGTLPLILRYYIEIASTSVQRTFTFCRFFDSFLLIFNANRPFYRSSLRLTANDFCYTPYRHYKHIYTNIIPLFIKRMLFDIRKLYLAHDYFYAQYFVFIGSFVAYLTFDT